ncbi:MAG TPA: hypothetical protein VK054_11365, partial [Beutenbergiaceae bacterium]|nr:hypothetical protein [Beutenbergiaceae bacterium]
MARKRQRKRSAATDAWLQDLNEAPRAQMPETKHDRRRRVTAFYVWSAVILLPLVIFGTFITYMDMSTRLDELSAPGARAAEAPEVV